MRAKILGIVSSPAYTAKLNEVNPGTYPCDTLAKNAGGHPINRIDELMPQQHTVVVNPSKLTAAAKRLRIECFTGHLKEQRRIATRYEETASSLFGFVLLGRIRIWIRFVHGPSARDLQHRA